MASSDALALAHMLVSVSPKSAMDGMDPVLSSFLAGSATVLGAFVVFCLKRSPGDAVLSFALSFSAGIMIVVAIVDVLFPPLSRLQSGKDAVAVFVPAVVGGIVAFTIARCLPDESILSDYLGHVLEAPDDGESKSPPFPPPHPEGERNAEDVETGHAPAPAAATGGSPSDGASAAQNDEGPVSPSGEDSDPRRPLLQQQVRHRSKDGAAARAASDDADADVDRDLLDGEKENRLPPEHHWRLAVLVLLVLTIHNFPEGMAVSASVALSNEEAEEATRFLSLGGQARLTMVRHGGGHTAEHSLDGTVMTLAIGLHNIAEGAIVAIPMLAASHSRLLAVVAALVSGLTEPVAAAITIFLIGSTPSEKLIETLLYGVAGFMLYVSLWELFPESVIHAHRWATSHPKVGWNRVTVGFVGLGTLTGVATMSVALWLLGFKG